MMVQVLTLRALARCRDDRKRIEKLMVRYRFHIQRASYLCGEHVDMRRFRSASKCWQNLPSVRDTRKQFRFQSNWYSRNSRRSMTRERSYLHQNADWRVSESVFQLPARAARSIGLDNPPSPGMAWTVRSCAELRQVPVSRAELSARKERARDAHSR
jgi:hypothetical protein